MDKRDCGELIENLGKFLIKNKNMYSQNMTNKLKEKRDVYKICCETSKVNIVIQIELKESNI